MKIIISEAGLSSVLDSVFLSWKHHFVRLNGSSNRTVLPLFESSTLEVPSHKSVQIAATTMNLVWMHKPGFVVHSYLSEETLCLWFETLYIDNTVLMTEAVQLEYFEGAINETIKLNYVVTFNKLLILWYSLNYTVNSCF